MTIFVMHFWDCWMDVCIGCAPQHSIYESSTSFCMCSTICTWVCRMRSAEYSSILLALRHVHHVHQRVSTLQFTEWRTLFDSECILSLGRAWSLISGEHFSLSRRWLLHTSSDVLALINVLVLVRSLLRCKALCFSSKLHIIYIGQSHAFL